MPFTEKRQGASPFCSIYEGTCYDDDISILSLLQTTIYNNATAKLLRCPTGQLVGKLRFE
jgi:hypothetical protein